MDHPAPRRSGIDSLLCDLAEIRRLAGRRVGILTNDACRAADGTTTAAALQHAFSQFADTSGLCLLSAEHGATVQAPAGTPVADTIHPATGLSVHSLYGPARPTTMAHARQLETVIIDVRDIGVRCYTYATTAAELIAGLRGSNTEVIVCDRANPLAVTREIGPPPSIDLRSFLAFLEVPFVHRRSIGRLLGDFHAKLGPDRPPLCIIPYQTPSGSNPGPWVPPSPALDHADAVQLYPGLVLLEGTNVSEGRGTIKSFRSILAPWIDAEQFMEHLASWRPHGIAARPWRVRPSAGDHAGRLCAGIALRVVLAHSTGR